jgi:hypothetical protein
MVEKQTANATKPISFLGSMAIAQGTRQNAGIMYFKILA